MSAVAHTNATASPNVRGELRKRDENPTRVAKMPHAAHKWPQRGEYVVRGAHANVAR